MPFSEGHCSRNARIEMKRDRDKKHGWYRDGEVGGSEELAKGCQTCARGVSFEPVGRSQ